MEIRVQVLYKDQYFIHRLERIGETLFWVHRFDDPYAREIFPDCQILPPNGRDMSRLRVPYMEGDL